MRRASECRGRLNGPAVACRELRPAGLRREVTSIVHARRSPIEGPEARFPPVPPCAGRRPPRAPPRSAGQLSRGPRRRRLPRLPPGRSRACSHRPRSSAGPTRPHCASWSHSPGLELGQRCSGRYRSGPGRPHAASTVGQGGRARPRTCQQPSRRSPDLPVRRSRRPRGTNAGRGHGLPLTGRTGRVLAPRNRRTHRGRSGGLMRPRGLACDACGDTSGGHGAASREIATARLGSRR